MGFGELNDNMIKGLISLLSVEQDIESIAYNYGLCINKYIQGSIVGKLDDMPYSCNTQNFISLKIAELSLINYL